MLCALYDITPAMSFPVVLALMALPVANSGASDTRLDLNPALAAYQDESICFPFQTHMYQVYRNYKSDPLLGGEAKCVKADPTGPLVDSQVQATFEYGSDGVIDTTLTLVSSPGYTVPNVIQVSPQDGSPPINLTVAYRDCAKCKIFRHSYIDNGTGCTYWVTEEGLREDTTCCEFVYDLLCGTSPKYQIYDESCQ